MKKLLIWMFEPLPHDIKGMFRVTLQRISVIFAWVLSCTLAFIIIHFLIMGFRWIAARS